MKDPAFLFYSKDFYEGTRLMIPEERACFIDLLIYQHQNDYIPNEIKRIMMYCSGVDKATLEATLQAKFKLCDKGWFNEKLAKVIEERKLFSSKQSINGVVGQYFKKAKSLLKPLEYGKFRKLYNEHSNTDIFNEIKEIDLKDEATLKAMLIAKLKHLEDVIEDVSINKIDWDIFLKTFNEITNKRLRVVEEKAKRQLNFILESGYTKEEIVKAIDNCYKDPYHIETGHMYLTPEFISRIDKFQKYVDVKKVKKEKKEEKL